MATEEGGHVIACALARRTEKVHSHFKQALAVDDFLARVEVRCAALQCFECSVPGSGVLF